MDISGVASYKNFQSTGTATSARARPEPPPQDGVGEAQDPAANLTNAASNAAASASKNGGTVREQVQSQLNVSIVQSSLDISLKSGNEPLALLYKSAISNINETLKADLGENAIQNAAGQDNSAQATAQRIVQLSTGFFASYKKQHPEQDDATARKQFVETIKGGFEQGYKEATDILQGLKVLNGDIADNVQKTHELVLKGYADFVAAGGEVKAEAKAG